MVVSIILYRLPLQNDGNVCTTEMLRREALHIADELNLEGFRASTGYLTNFMKRSGVEMWCVFV